MFLYCSSSCVVIVEILLQSELTQQTAKEKLPPIAQFPSLLTVIFQVHFFCFLFLPSAYNCMPVPIDDLLMSFLLL